MVRSRRHSQELFSNRDSGVVDRLNVDIVILHEKVASFLSKLSITYENRNNMRLPRKNRNSFRSTFLFDCSGNVMDLFTEFLMSNYKNI